MTALRDLIELALAAALDALAADPDTARVLFVEAPSAGEEIALSYHEWLRRYGTLLRSVTAEVEPGAGPALEVDEVIVGGIASRVASEVLRGRGGELRTLTASFAEYVLAFFRAGEPGPKEGRVIAFDAEPETGSYEARGKQASA